MTLECLYGSLGHISSMRVRWNELKGMVSLFELLLYDGRQLIVKYVKFGRETLLLDLG